MDESSVRPEGSIVMGEVVEVVGGFSTYAPLVTPSKFEVLGDDMQILSIKLDKDEEVVAEPGSMNFMHPTVRMSVNCKDCCGRWCSGESCIMSTYRALSSGAYLALTSKVPGKIIPIELQTHGGKLRARTSTFFASIGEVKLNYDCDWNPLTCCCGGQGLIHQSISGQGTAFLTAMGTILQKELADKETLIVDTHSLVAWQDTAKLGVRTSGGCCTCCCGGEGLFNTTITGPGHVYLQSMSKQRFKAALAVQAAQQQTGAAQNKKGRQHNPPPPPGATPSAESMHR